MIYTEIVAAFATLLSLIWLVPFTWTFLHYPIEFFISIMWFASFGALYDWIHINGLNCTGVFGVWNWDGNTHDYYCDEYKVLEGFIFMSALFWLASAGLVGNSLSIYVQH